MYTSDDDIAGFLNAKVYPPPSNTGAIFYFIFMCSQELLRLLIKRLWRYYFSYFEGEYTCYNCMCLSDKISKK